MNAPSTCTQNNPSGHASVPFRLPGVDLFETQDGYTIEADVPGVSRESLEIYLDQNELTVLGRRNPRATPIADHYRESRSGDFRRSFELGPTIDTEKITARVENGVLTLHLARRTQDKPRQITVSE